MKILEKLFHHFLFFRVQKVNYGLDRGQTLASAIECAHSETKLGVSKPLDGTDQTQDIYSEIAQRNQIFTGKPPGTENITISRISAQHNIYTHRK